MYRLSLPIYYTQEFKTKKNKTFLVSMNWYRNAHHFAQNQVKQYYHALIKGLMKDFKDEELEVYRVKYKLYYKNSNCDMMNVVSMIDKFFNDAIQDMNIIKNDNVKFYKRCSIEVIEQDRNNPRVEIEMEEI